jgi:hypothetical protein
LKIVLVTFGLVAAAYIAVAGLAFFKQRSMIYYPNGESLPASLGFEIVRLPTEDGLELVAGYRAAAAGSPTLVAFHGNAANWQSMAASLAPLADQGFGVLSVQYRGYRGNPGTPTEQGLYEDGRAALRWLGSAGIADRDIVVVGNSLGSGVAVQLASERTLRAVVLVSPVSSIARLASARMAWLPVDLLLTDRFDNVAKLGKLSSPILILHGDSDRVIPLSEGKFLAAQNKSASLIVHKGAGHDLMYQEQILPEIARFLSRT